MVDVTGHRGAGFLEPENTLRSIRRAVELGVDQVEIDVHLTKDKKIIVIHDDTLDRTTDGHGLVHDCTLAELKKLDAGKGERLPTLQEIFDTIKGKATLQIEIKDLEIVKRLVKEIEENSMVGDVIVTSFDHPTVKRVKEINPRIETGVLFVCRPINVVQLAVAARADAVHPNLSYVDRLLVSEAHKSNLKVRVWNADNEEQITRMLGLGVDAIGSNRPDLVLKLLNRTQTR